MSGDKTPTTESTETPTTDQVKDVYVQKINEKGETVSIDIQKMQSEETKPDDKIETKPDEKQEKPTETKPEEEKKTVESESSTNEYKVELYEDSPIPMLEQEEFVRFVKESGVAADVAQKLVEKLDTSVMNYKQHQVKLVAENAQKNLDDLKTDADLGAANYPKTQEQLDSVFKDDAEIKKLFTDIGVINHPRVVKFFLKMLAAPKVQSGEINKTEVAPKTTQNPSGNPIPGMTADEWMKANYEGTHLAR